MVCSGAPEEARERVPHRCHMLMATAPERSQPLHNFQLPFLKWGNQKYLRCVNVNSGGGDADHRAPAPRIDSSPINRGRELEEKGRLVRDSERRERIAKRKIYNGEDGEDEEEEGIEAVREKLLYDLKNAKNKIENAILREEADVAAAPEETRPWNLRTRRAALKAPSNDGGGDRGWLKIEDKRLNSSPVRSEGNGVKSPIVRGGAEKEREKFAQTLSRKEIEEDFIMLGERMRRRPKKRPKIVQKQIDSLLPALWLTEVTPDLY